MSSSHIIIHCVGHKSSPTHSRLNPELSVEKDEGISDDDDPTELRLLLELSEQVR